jgi:hypothetical protein
MRSSRERIGRNTISESTLATQRLRIRGVEVSGDSVAAGTRALLLIDPLRSYIFFTALLLYSRAPPGVSWFSSNNTR